MTQFHGQNRCLQRIQAAVHSNFLVEILGLHAVIAQTLHARAKFVIVGGNDSAIAKAAKIFTWKETVGSNVAARTHAYAAMILGANGLRAIFYDRHLVILGDLQNGIQVGGLSKQVDWNNRFHVFDTTKSFLQTLRANVVCGGINVHKYWPRAQPRNTSRGREECVRWHDH